MEGQTDGDGVKWSGSDRRAGISDRGPIGIGFWSAAIHRPFANEQDLTRAAASKTSDLQEPSL
jgi:hypothetical protein